MLLATVCCRPQLQMSRWLVVQQARGVVQDYSIGLGRLELEAMSFRQLLARSHDREAELEVLAGALVCATVFCRARLASLSLEPATSQGSAVVGAALVDGVPFEQLCAELPSSLAAVEAGDQGSR